jgi:hypothetical protein
VLAKNDWLFKGITAGKSGGGNGKEKNGQKL